MGNWGRKVENGFDSMFDLNGDGILDGVEESMQYLFMEQELKEIRSGGKSVFDDEDAYEEDY